jgi:hypothetical protein
MASSSPRVDSAPQLPDYVQVPEAAFGPALNEQGYLVSDAATPVSSTVVPAYGA